MQSNNSVTQVSQQQNTLSSQGQLYMSQQNENLKYMYTLISQLRTQTKQNQHIKDNIMECIDTLTNKLNRDPEKMSDNINKDICIFKLFLDRNSVNIAPLAATPDDIQEPNEYLFQLKIQNKMLQELLAKRKQISSCSVLTLKHHEDSLSKVINLLRDDILQYQTSTLQEIRQQFSNIILNYENMEFQEYVENTEELQKVFHILKVYRIICSLLDD